MTTTNNDLAEHLIADEKRLAVIENDIKNLTSKVSSLETSVSDLVTAWKTAGGIVSFVKWLAGLATALTAIILFIKSGGIK